MKFELIEIKKILEDEIVRKTKESSKTEKNEVNDSFYAGYLQALVFLIKSINVKLENKIL